MEYHELIKLGFNKNEAIVYLSLIKFKKADALQIIKDTKFHKNIVYDNLEKLIDKGLVTFVMENSKKSFQLAPSNMLIQFFEEQEEEIKEKKEKAIEFSKEIDKLTKKAKIMQEAQVYRGIKGMKAYFNQTLEGEDIFAFGAPQSSVDIMGELFWQNYETKRAKQKIHAKLIFNPSLREYGKTLNKKTTEIRYFNQAFEPLTETQIQGNNVAIMVWTDEPFLFLIKSKEVANSYRKFFENMWKQAKS
ncbi:TPA: TrmB family transcriptional regulator [Candidatus Woesearchaeota archaeon]|nr:TrmB family transcriptional regulator [Candidatus Woesearchaeota archaeon]